MPNTQHGIAGLQAGVPTLPMMALTDQQRAEIERQGQEEAQQPAEALRLAREMNETLRWARIAGWAAIAAALLGIVPVVQWLLRK